MAKQFRFLMSRTSLIQESFWVEADSETEAMEMGFDGEVDNGEPAFKEWIDYHDDEWSIDEKEVICPLHQMVKDYQLEKALK
jgi:hypothetical protein